MIQSQQSWLITAHLNKANARRWRSSSMMSPVTKCFHSSVPLTTHNEGVGGGVIKHKPGLGDMALYTRRK